MNHLLHHILLVAAALLASLPATAGRTLQMKGAPSPGRTGYRTALKTPLQRPLGIGPLAAINSRAGADGRLLAPAMRVPGSNSTFNAVLVYSDDWAEGDTQAKVEAAAGVYAMPLRSDRDLTLLRNGIDWFDTRAAVKVGNTFYVIMANFEGENTRYASCSTSTWYLTGSEEIDPANVATDLAYDPTTSKVYGYFYYDYTNDYNRFCTFDVATGESYDIAVGTPVYAIACNQQGELYGITYMGDLVRIDKSTGNQFVVGHTGMIPIDRNSMAFDESTGKLYWAATCSSWYNPITGLYEVNTSNAELTLVREFANHESFAGLTFASSTVPTSAPAAVTDIGVTFTDRGALTGTLAFTAPTTAIDLTPLTGTISTIVTIAGSDTIIEHIAPGQRVEVDMTFPEGRHTAIITTADNDNRGAMASYEFYAGEDLPGTPVDVVLTERDGAALLTWQPAPLGLNGGEYDTKGVTYTIVRYPDQVTVASGVVETTFTDRTLTGEDQSVFYTVTAVTDIGCSDAARSNSYVFGNGFTVPFFEPFASQGRFDLWTIDDLNGGPTWQYHSEGHYAFYDYGNTNLPANDWLISPRIALEAGKQYKLSYWAKTRSKTYVENFRVALGTAPNAAAMTLTLDDHPSWADTGGQTLTTTFTVDHDGVYHLGFLCYSAAQMWQLQITNVSIETMDDQVPAPVADLTVTAGALGAMNATIRCTAPTTTDSGEPLTSLAAVNVYRNGSDAPVHTFANPVPGATLQWQDNGMTEAAVYTYRVVAANGAGQSLEASASAFVGVDAPGAPGGLRLEDHDGQAVLTWQAPTSGRNGGYFDASNLTYQVWRYDNYTMLADRQTATTYTDASTQAITEQTLIDYVVFPYCGDTRGAYALSNAVVFGTPYEAPITETFRSSTEHGMNYYPWVAQSDQTMNQGWTLENSGSFPVANDQNGDYGMAVFHSRGESAGIHAWLTSPKISAKNLSNPQVAFYMYHSHIDGATTQESLELEYSVNGVDFVRVDGAKWMRDDGTTGWARHTVNLPQAAGCENLRIAFVGTTDGLPTQGHDIYIDNIAIGNQAATDLAVDIDGPRTVIVNESGRFAITVSNLGTQNVQGYEVKIRDSQGYSASLTGYTVAPGTSKTTYINHSFGTAGMTDMTVTVACNGDENALNDSASIRIRVAEPAAPSASGLTGTLTGDEVDLQWTRHSARGAVADSVETYTDWAIDSVGEWTMVDLDHQATYYINNNLDYPHQSDPKAWQVCNAHALGIDVWDEGRPHSGHKMFMAMSAASGPNDDWLISPTLNGKSHIISFFAKAFTDQDDQVEQMSVLYSTGGTDPVDFTPLAGARLITVPAVWTEYVFVVPNGATHFAIRCVSPGGMQSFALFVDDLRFNDLTVPQWQFAAYHVFRNGVKIGSTTESHYTDADLRQIGRATYTVKTVFDQGESAMSNPWTVARPEDINADGIIDINDVNILINIILELTDPQQYPTADANGDGHTDIGDVNRLLNILLR